SQTLVSQTVSQASAGQATHPPDVSVQRGEQVFTQHCATCHGAGGQGAEPWYPSMQRLAGMRRPSEMVEAVLTGRFGRSGDLNGHTIPIMPAWGHLSDADIAAIVNYIQQEWGEGGAVDIEAVTRTRNQLWELD
ncbi:MAG: cytochrome c, partial [Pseudomonadota bacterium]